MAGGMKLLAKETAIYGMSSIIGRFVNWMLVPMYTRTLESTGERSPFPYRTSERP